LPARGRAAQSSGVPSIASTLPDAARSELVDIGPAWNGLGGIAVELTLRRFWTGSVPHEVTSGQLTVPYADAWLGDGP
jgi:hypothetical protein